MSAGKLVDDDSSVTRGRCWILPDNIDTDALAPGLYIKSPIETLASHCLESVNRDFASAVKPGDLILAGRNFGMGSSREQAAQALLVLGVAGVVAESFGGIFFRNAINLGLPVFTPAAGVVLTELVNQHDSVSLDIEAARLINHSADVTAQLQALPDFLITMLNSGGLVKVLEKRFLQSP